MTICKNCDFRYMECGDIIRVKEFDGNSACADCGKTIITNPNKTDEFLEEDRKNIVQKIEQLQIPAYESDEYKKGFMTACGRMVKIVRTEEETL